MSDRSTLLALALGAAGIFSMFTGWIALAADLKPEWLCWLLAIGGSQMMAVSAVILFGPKPTTSSASE